MLLCSRPLEAPAHFKVSQAASCFLSVFLTFHGRKLLHFSFIGERPVLGKLHGHGRRAGGSVVHLAMARLYPEQRVMRLLPRLCPCFVTSLMTGQKTLKKQGKPTQLSRLIPCPVVCCYDVMPSCVIMCSHHDCHD